MNDASICERCGWSSRSACCGGCMMGEKLFTVTLSESELLEVRYALDRSGASESLYARLDAATFGSAPVARPDEDELTFGSVPLPRPRPANYIERPREWDGA